MHLKATKFALIGVMFATPALMQAQFDFKIGDVPVQMHSFGQQGFAYSNQNNYLTMGTSQGSFAMTDGGANISAAINDKFRVGAQVYDRNIGQLGRGTLQLDWAYGDYKFKDWFGIRAGKVKTALGLFNDTQDAEFLYTWALLPQGVYPLDLRSNTIAHTGGDVYGEFSLRKAGSFSYTAYAGLRENDTKGGLYYGDASAQTPVRSFSGRTEGMDLRWHTPLQGLMIGGSFANQTQDLVLILSTDYNVPLSALSHPDHRTAGYADYVRGKFHLNTEFRRANQLDNLVIEGAASGIYNLQNKAWFGTIAYRVAKRLEIGAYNSRFYVGSPSTPTNPASTHIFDQTIAARFDITSWCNLKVEEHFINGYGDTYSAHGFYSADNPAGLKPTTDMLVVRMGFYR